MGSIFTIEGWNENIGHDVVTVSVTPEIYDAKGAIAIYIAVLTENVGICVSPTSVSSVGLIMIRDTTNNPRSEPSVMRLELGPRPAPVYLSSLSATPSVSILRIYAQD